MREGGPRPESDKPKTGLSPENQRELERLEKIIQDAPDPTPEEMEQLQKSLDEREPKDGTDNKGGVE